MNKDNKSDRSFQEKLKKWLKSDKKNISGVREFKITEDYKTRLGSDAMLIDRINVIKELTEILKVQKLEDNGIQKIWEQIRDLLTTPTPYEHRNTALQLLTTIASVHENLGIFRLFFFNYIIDNSECEDITPIFNFFKAVTDDGRRLDYIEESAGLFYLKWLPSLLKSDLSHESVHIIMNLVKCNSSYLDENIINGFVKEVIYLMMRSESEQEIRSCLQTLSAHVAYSYLPIASYPIYISAMAHIVSVPQLTEEAWKIMKSLYGTELGSTAVYTTCNIIETSDNLHRVRGCIYFLTRALWGSDRVLSLNFTLVHILPTLNKASESSYALVIYETAISMHKLISNFSLELTLSTWDTVLQIIARMFEFSVSLESEYEEHGKVICNVLNDTIDEIDKLLDSQHFFGSKEQLYDLIEKYSYMRQEYSVIRVIEYRASLINPGHAHWLSHLGTLMIRYYKQDPRTNIRITTLRKIRKIFDCHLLDYGEEMLDAVILTQLEGIDEDPNVEVRKEVVNLLVHLATPLQTAVSIRILDIVKKVVLRPYNNSLGGEVVKMEENEAADVYEGVCALVKFFKRKIWMLPSSHAIKAYHILLVCLINHYYYNPEVLKNVLKIRKVIFEMIFELRANADYHLGLPNCKDAKPKVFEDFSELGISLPKYSPYIKIDHKFGLKPERLNFVPQERPEKSNLLEQLMQALSMFSDGLIPHHQEEVTSKPAEDLSPQTPESMASPQNHVKIDCLTESLEASTSDKVNDDFTSTSDVQVTSVSLAQVAWIVVVAIMTEKDWELLQIILEKIPHVLQNKALILSKDNNDINYFAQALCSLINDGSLNLSSVLYNTPGGTLPTSTFHHYVFPVLASLTSYHMFLSLENQRNIIKCLQYGMQSKSVAFCVRSLTLCILEMQDAMVKQVREVMLNVSKISATVPNARPVLEFLSTLLHLPRVYANFGGQEYMTVFAIAIPYTNPIKFNHYIVSLAYHVVGMWYLKCRLSLRKIFTPFITKSLYTALATEEQLKRQSMSSLNEQTEAKMEKFQFHKDLIETCVDLMSRYAFYSYAPNPKRSGIAEMLVKGGLQQSWLVGNKIVTVTTSSCSQRPYKNGICDKCYSKCGLDRVTTDIEATSMISQRRRHRSEMQRTVTHESKIKPQSKDDLHMRSSHTEITNPLLPQYDKGGSMMLSRQLSSPCSSPCPANSSTNTSTVALDQVVDGGFSTGTDGITSPAKNNTQSESHLCACWCVGWAEIYIRQPTGNMSYMMRVQNHQTLFPDEDVLPIHELSSLYNPEYDAAMKQSVNRNLTLASMLSTASLDYDQFINSDAERPRAFSVLSSKTHYSDAGGSIPEWSTNCSGSGQSSGAASHASSETRLQQVHDNLAVDDQRVPVQRCHSSPEMTDGVESVPLDEDNAHESSKENLHTNTDVSPRTSLHFNSPSPVELHSSGSFSTSQDQSERKPVRTLSSSGSLRSTSPPNTASSTRVRHVSALQMRSSSSGVSSLPPEVFDEADGDDDGSPKPIRRGRGHTISDMNPASRKLQMRNIAPSRKQHTPNVSAASNNNTVTSSSSSSSGYKKKDHKGGIDPSSVFLHLYYHGEYGQSNYRPVFLPTNNPEIKRAIQVLDYIQPQENHKIGVIYVGAGQKKEQEILSNECGSLRYTLFIQGLGKCIDLDSNLGKEVFLGGLCCNGADGKNAYIWQDDVMQVVFHIATMMPNKETDTNFSGKKRHIGNNYVTIVYNNSGEPYDMNTFSGQFNHSYVEIVPGDHSTNSVCVYHKQDMFELVGENGAPRLVSDANLAILVRQLALHADLASVVWQSLKMPQMPYASNWLERMRKIRSIKEKVAAVIEPLPASVQNQDFTDFIDFDGTKSKATSKKQK